MYPSKLRKLLLEGQGPSMLSESKENNMLTQDIEETAWGPGQLGAGGQRQRVLFPPPPPNMTHVSLFALNHSDSDYLEIDVSAGRWRGLR